MEPSPIKPVPPVLTPEQLEAIKNALPNAVIARGPAKGKETTKVKVLSGKQDDGTAVFICNKVPDCEWTNTNYNSVVSHLGKHVRHGEVERSDAWYAATNRPDMHYHPKESSIANSLRRIADEVEARQTEDKWRKRALKAEKELRDLRASVAKFTNLLGGS